MFIHRLPVGSRPRLVVLDGCGGDYEGAGQSYNQALTLDPTNADALVARGAARANQGQLRCILFLIVEGYLCLFGRHAVYKFLVLKS